MVQQPKAIEIVGIRKSYGTNTVLDGIDLSVQPGTVFGLLGPNGAGKTTLIKILSTLIAPDSGHARVAGHDIAADADDVRHSISLTGQYAAVDEVLTGEENLRMMARLSGFSRAEAKDRARELLAQFDLLDAAGKRAATYSGGMRRRLDLAASLVSRPSVVFLDEPTTGLDTRSRQTLWAIITELARAGTTVFLTTQYLEEADQLADRIAVINNGKVVAEGSADELKAKIGTDLLHLTFDTRDDYDRVVAEFSGIVAKREPDQLRVSLITDGSADQVRTLLNELAGRKMHVGHLALDKPTMDDVFLALTESGVIPERVAEKGTVISHVN